MKRPWPALGRSATGKKRNVGMSLRSAFASAEELCVVCVCVCVCECVCVWCVCVSVCLCVCGYVCVCV